MIEFSIYANIHRKIELKFLLVLNLNVSYLIFHISDFHNLKIVNDMFFFIFEGGLKFLSRSVYIYIYIYMCVCVCELILLVDLKGAVHKEYIVLIYPNSAHCTAIDI